MRNIDALTYFKGDDLAAKVWADKYALKDDNGNILETNPNSMHTRMASEFARIEAKYGGSKAMPQELIESLFRDFKYIIPGGSVMAGLGSPMIGSLSNCFVIGQPEDSYSGIMKLREEQAHLMKRRGGVGKDLSTLRPAGAKVHNTAKSSTGAASFMEVDSSITQEVAQRGRRGALMLTLDIRHPDVEEFITKKQDLSKVTGANISVKVTDDFMKAVMKDEDYILRWPVTTKVKNTAFQDLEYGKLLCLEHPREDTCYYFKRVRARKLWELLVHCAWNTAEPGIMFSDRHINFSPDGVYPQYRGISTNPCGEIFMQPYDSCRLIHLNLTSFIRNPYTENACIDFETLKNVAKYATRLGDDLVDLEVEAIDRILGHIKSSIGNNLAEWRLWHQIKQTALDGRRCGIGFTGLADALAMMNVGFDQKGKEITEQILRTIFAAELEEEISLAKERGFFKGWSAFLEQNSKDFDTNDWYNMVLKEFPELYAELQKYGRRNISFSTVAPTGTVSILTQTSSGIEPVFSLYYVRRKKCGEGEIPDFIDQNGEKFKEFKIFHRPFIVWAQKRLGLATIEATIDMINSLEPGDFEALLQGSPWYKQTAPEIDWKTRIQIQGIAQKYTTHSISSTLNLPKDVTEKEVSDIYTYAFEQGLKGVTVYREGCRSGILVTNTTDSNTFVQHSAPKRPKVLEAELHIIKVKRIKYAVIVGLFEHKPYEVFAFELGEGNFLPQKGKIIKIKRGHYNFIGDEDLNIEGLHLANDKVEERASSIYISMLLRHGAPIEYVISTMKKVSENIASFTSAVCRVLMEYCTKGISDESCPECGAALTREAGCKKCNNCGYSVCLTLLVKY